MLRAIFRRRMRDAISGFEVTNQLFSFRVDVPSIENELRKGGFGPAGYEVVELIGIEIEKQEDSPRKSSYCTDCTNGNHSDSCPFSIDGI